MEKVLRALLTAFYKPSHGKSWQPLKTKGTKGTEAFTLSLTALPLVCAIPLDSPDVQWSGGTGGRVRVRVHERVHKRVHERVSLLSRVRGPWQGRGGLEPRARARGSLGGAQRSRAERAGGGAAPGAGAVEGPGGRRGRCHRRAAAAQAGTQPAGPAGGPAEPPRRAETMILTRKFGDPLPASFGGKNRGRRWRKAPWGQRMGQSGTGPARVIPRHREGSAGRGGCPVPRCGASPGAGLGPAGPSGCAGQKRRRGGSSPRWDGNAAGARDYFYVWEAPAAAVLGSAAERDNPAGAEARGHRGRGAALGMRPLPEDHRGASFYFGGFWFWVFFPVSFLFSSLIFVSLWFGRLFFFSRSVCETGTVEFLLKFSVISPMASRSPVAPPVQRWPALMSLPAALIPVEEQHLLPDGLTPTPPLPFSLLEENRKPMPFSSRTVLRSVSPFLSLQTTSNDLVPPKLWSCWAMCCH